MIEMFDPQYYLQMYRELQAIAPELEAQEATQLKAKEQERRERIHRQYDEAIRKIEAKLRHGYNKDAHKRRIYGKSKHL